ncbi:MAG: sodium-translocating pyrophosphatase [Planctomycetaceae bacterium]|nr:sodium-translocating pyrophosphatase [Planctomycetaceae bacterium]
MDLLPQLKSWSLLLGQANGSANVTGVAATEYVFWAILLGASVAALGFAYRFYQSMMQADPGTPRMIEIAGFVREGANAYLKQQYVVVSCFMLAVFGLLLWASYAEVQEKYVPFAFLTGGFWSGFAGFLGMRTATSASNRTAAGAMKSLNEGLQVAFRSGAVMGLCVVGLGLFDMAFWYAILRFVLQLDLNTVTITMLCSLMGASSQALFARVGGGIFTKAADVGADLVGKVEKGIPEDDPRNPATIADNVGDNVGDVAGMGADLYESYCGSILASAALGYAAMSAIPGATPQLTVNAVFLPMMIAALGVAMSIACIYLVRAGEDASQKALLKVLAWGIDTSMLAVLALSWVLTYLFLGSDHIMVAASITVGLAAGWLIGKWTEYATSDEYRPTQLLSEQALTGPATVIIAGLADGMKSVWMPVLVVCVATALAFGCANGFRFDDAQYFTLGLYGVGIAAVGMLSTLGITLATDAYGPIADNAGGNAEMSHLDPIVRKRTDALDSLGNTTAATGKGFAIGSAALTALALLAAYVDQVRIGFERWAVTEPAIKTADTLYKVSDKFAALRTASSLAETATSSEQKLGTHSYLVMPNALRNADVKKNWNAIAKGQAVPEGVLTRTNSETGAPEFKFAASGEALVNVRTAYLSDFANFYDASVLNPRVLIGAFLGCMATFVFCAMTMQAVGRAARGMVNEVRRQFAENPGIMDGTSQPDYARPVAISTKAAQREMILPSLLGLLLPIAAGWVLGVGGVLGLLVGCLTCGFCVAIFMANAGGSWDNAKKYVEAGNHGGKGSEAHKAAVVGDTVGDPFKDTSGPSLNILIKLMSMVSVVAAGFIVRYSLSELGWF